MSEMKSNSGKAVLWAVIVSILVNVFFGRWIAAKVSVLPVLNRFKLLNPQTPIVITQRQEVKVLDQSSLAESVSKAQSKLSLVVADDGLSLSPTGSAINLTSDGLFLTAAEFLPKKPGQKFYIVLNDGQMAEATLVIKDTATPLAVVKAPLTTSAAAFAVSKEFRAGDLLAAVQNSLNRQPASYEPVYVKEAQQANGSVRQSDFPTRTFVLSDANLTGRVVVSRDGEVGALVTTAGIISSDVIRKFVSLYFAGAAPARIALGLDYKNFGATEAAFYKVPQGVRVLEVVKPSVAQSAGFLAGDVITAINGEALNNITLEEVLEKYKPGDEVKFEVYRNDAKLNISAKLGELK